MEKLNWNVIAFVVLALLVGGLVGYVSAPQEVNGMSTAEVNEKVQEAVNKSLFQKNAEIETLRDLIAKSGEVNETDTIDIEIESPGYLIDELYLGELLEKTYSDREINLFDGKVDFDGDAYDAEETLKFKDIKLLANGNDFEGNVYMTLLEESVEYKFEFESDLNTSLIDEEDTLEFSLLGKDVEISNWEDDVVTLFIGTKMMVDEDQIVDFEDYKIMVISISDESIYLSVEDSNGELETKIINEDKTRNVNGLKIRVNNVFSSQTKSFAELVIGEDIDNEVEDGEEYEEDSIWNWKITSNSIGIILNEAFTKVDKEGDEEFSAVGASEKFCLPNEYKSILFNGMIKEDTEEYNLELDEKAGTDYVRVDGNFESGTKDFDRIYVNVLTYEIFDEDFELIHATEIVLGNTKSKLVTSVDGLTFEDFEVNYALDDATANGNNLNSFDEKYTTDYGITIDNVEEMVEDNEFTIEVPEEKLEGSISLI